MQENIGMISMDGVAQINDFMMQGGKCFWREIEKLINKYGGVEEINRKAYEAGRVENLLRRLQNMDSPYYKDVLWLQEQCDKKAFISISEYRKKVFGEEANRTYFNEANAVTLEISPVQFFPWIIREAEKAIDEKSIMPARYIRLRGMKEQENDNGDILAMEAAVRILGGTKVESMDSKGTDGSNLHLGGPDTILGYCAGVGQPNDHVLMYLDEVLYYHTQYGINKVLNFNLGSILGMLMMYRAGINVKFKVSALVGTDNPYSTIMLLALGKMYQRSDGTCGIDGINLTNSVDTNTIRNVAKVRREMGFEDTVRIEHHVTEPVLGVVKMPYLRRDQVVELAGEIPNFSAKHEGSEIDAPSNLKHPWSIMEDFMPKAKLEEAGLLEGMAENYMDKHESVNLTAEALTRKGIAFIAASNAHRR